MTARPRFSLPLSKSNCVRLLIENSADVNKETNFAESSLLMASRNGHLDCVRLLIKRGAAINDEFKKTPSFKPTRDPRPASRLFVLSSVHDQDAQMQSMRPSLVLRPRVYGCRVAVAQSALPATLDDVQRDC